MTVEVDIKIDIEKHIHDLHKNGYTVVEGLLNDNELNELQNEMDKQIERQLNDPYDPGDGPSHPDDDEIEAYYRASYPSCPEKEYKRIMRLIRYTRHQNYDTPWCVPFDQVLKKFSIDRQSRMAARRFMSTSWLPAHQSFPDWLKIQIS